MVPSVDFGQLSKTKQGPRPQPLKRQKKKRFKHPAGRGDEHTATDQQIGFILQTDRNLPLHIREYGKARHVELKTLETWPKTLDMPQANT